MSGQPTRTFVYVWEVSETLGCIPVSVAAGEMEGLQSSGEVVYTVKIISEIIFLRQDL